MDKNLLTNELIKIAKSLISDDFSENGESEKEDEEIKDDQITHISYVSEIRDLSDEQKNIFVKLKATKEKLFKSDWQDQESYRKCLAIYNQLQKQLNDCSESFKNLKDSLSGRKFS